jgi:hypothetical protein
MRSGGRSACAPSGRIAAAPPRSAMKSRRLTIASAKTNHVLKKASTDYPSAGPGASPFGWRSTARRPLSMRSAHLSNHPGVPEHRGRSDTSAMGRFANAKSIVSPQAVTGTLGLIRIFAKATLPVCTCRPMKPESGSSLLMRPRKRSLGSAGSAVNFVDG